MICTREEYPHGLRCIVCSREICWGDEYRERLVSIGLADENDYVTTEVVCPDCEQPSDTVLTLAPRDSSDTDIVVAKIEAALVRAKECAAIGVTIYLDLPGHRFAMFTTCNDTSGIVGRLECCKHELLLKKAIEPGEST